MEICWRLKTEKRGKMKKGIFLFVENKQTNNCLGPFSSLISVNILSECRSYFDTKTAEHEKSVEVEVFPSLLESIRQQK